MKKLSPSLIGVVMTALALFALGQLLYSTYQQRQIVECQAIVNQSFLDVLKQRAAISDGDRDAIRGYVNDMNAAQNPQEQSAATASFNQKAEQLDALRSSFSYPEIEGACR